MITPIIKRYDYSIKNHNHSAITALPVASAHTPELLLHGTASAALLLALLLVDTLGATSAIEVGVVVGATELTVVVVHGLAPELVPHIASFLPLPFVSYIILPASNCASDNSDPPQSLHNYPYKKRAA